MPTCTIEVLRATGHGAHGALPHERLFCVIKLTSGDGRTSEAATPAHTQPTWSGALGAFAFAPEASLRAELHGRLRDAADVLIGAGSLPLATLTASAQQAPNRQAEEVVKVPITSPLGADAGSIEIRLAVK